MHDVPLTIQFRLHLHQPQLQILASDLECPQLLDLGIPRPNHLIQSSYFDIDSRLVTQLSLSPRALCSVIIALQLFRLQRLIDSLQLLPQFADFYIQFLYGPISSSHLVK
jgi:hypothetical protein